MKIILTKDVPKLGSLGDAINVKDGYARNFLIPRGAAVLDTPQNIKMVGEKRKGKEAQSKRHKEEALVLAEKLANSSCTIAVKVIDEERLFGSVTAEMVQKALEADGVIIDKNAVHIEEPIKKLGVYQIPIKLHPEVVINFKVWVVKE